METIKKYLSFVVLPLTLIAGYIYYLLGKVDKLQGQVAQAKSEKDVAVTLNKLEEATSNADKAEADFQSSYTEFCDAVESDSTSSVPDKS